MNEDKSPKICPLLKQHCVVGQPKGLAHHAVGSAFAALLETEGDE